VQIKHHKGSCVLSSTCDDSHLPRVNNDAE